MKFIKTCCFLLSIFISSSLAAQTEELDSLKNEVLRESLHDTVKAYLYNDISYLYRSIDPIEVRKYARKALDFSKIDRPSKFLARSYLMLSRGYVYESIYDSALIYAKKSLAVGQAINHTISIVDANIELSVIWKEQGRYDEAFKAAFESLNIADSIGDDFRVAVFSLDIGLMFYDQYQTDEAVSSFQRSYNAFKELGIKGGMMAAKGNIGLAYKQIDASKAYETYDEMLKEFGSLFSKNDSARCFSNLGNILIDLERYDEAEKYILQALELREALNFPSSLAYSYKELAELYLKTEEFNKAKYYGGKALEVATEIGEISLLEMISKKNAVSSYELGQFEEAYRSLESHLTYKDSINKLDRIELSKELETKYETEKKEQQIELQNEKLRTQEVQIAKDEAIRNSLIGGAALLVIIASLVINRQKLNIRNKAKEKEIAELKLAKTRDELEVREQELLTYAISIAQKNNLLHNVKEDAKKSEDLIEANKRLRRINHEIENGYNLNQQWEEFRQRFEKIHQRFFDQLANLASDLTATDRRICAYLKLGLSSKQIANLQNVSVESVEVRRSQIRKKLGISKEENLGTFIMNIS